MSTLIDTETNPTAVPSDGSPAVAGSEDSPLAEHGAEGTLEVPTSRGRASSVAPVEGIASDDGADALAKHAELSGAVAQSAAGVSWRDLALAVLRSGELGVLSWNRRREIDPSKPDLAGQDLRGLKLIDIDLSNCSLRRARFDRAILLDARLGQSDLNGASLVGAQLQGSRLVGAKLQHARLERANLRWVDLTNADLRNADLSEAKVDPCDFAGADLEGAQFSRSALADFSESLTHIENAAGHPRGVFTALVGFCLFSVLTAITASPIALITKQGTVRLPLIDSEVTVVAFFFVAPIVSLGLLGYLAVHFAQLRRLVQRLPYRLPDGVLAVEKLSPWSQAAISCVSATARDGALAARSQQSVESLGLLIRWVVPTTATFMGWSLIRCRNAVDLWLHYALVVAIWLATALLWFRQGRRRTRASWVGGAMVCAAIVLIAGIIRSVTRRTPDDAPADAPRATGLTALVSRFLPTETLLPLRIRGGDLSNSVIQDTNLAGSDFSRANLSGAALREVDLQRALLYHANLKGVGGYCLNLHAARLVKADLSESFFQCVSLRGAQLNSADLSSAILRRVDLRAADLSGAAISEGTQFQDVVCDGETRWPKVLGAPPRCLSSPADISQQCALCTLR